MKGSARQMKNPKDNSPKKKQGKDWLDDPKILFPVSAKFVASQEGFNNRDKCNERTVRRWAGKNNVRTIGEGRGIQYMFFKEDVLRFRQRERPGRRWSKAKKKELP